MYDTGVTAEYGDKLITLSTCEYSAQNGRLVVVAKRVNWHDPMISYCACSVSVSNWMLLCVS